MSESTASEMGQRLARITALTRLTLSAVEDRRNHEGMMQAAMSHVQVSITLIARLHSEIHEMAGIDHVDQAADFAWMRFGDLLGLLDAEAWRLLSEHAEAPPEDKLADLEHGLRQLVDLAERTLAAARPVETREVEHA